jgi:uncharacterized protein (DUF427 family)
MTQSVTVLNLRGEMLDSDRVARTIIEPYPHEVVITVNDETVVHTRNGQLCCEGYAPDIYVPASDVRHALLSSSETEIYCPYKTGTAVYYHAVVGGKRIDDVAWSYSDPLGHPTLTEHYAFNFDKVKIEVDGRQVRGHVRDPHKIITVKTLEVNLRLEILGKVIVDTDRALILEETGLPSRFYIPDSDTKQGYLVMSERRSVCTYKGEANYYHLQVEQRLIENAVWTYVDAWTDFATDVGKIEGYLGFYTSTFDRVFLDHLEINHAANDLASDSDMIANPTIDQVLQDKIN